MATAGGPAHAGLDEVKDLPQASDDEDPAGREDEEPVTDVTDDVVAAMGSEGETEVAA